MNKNTGENMKNQADLFTISTTIPEGNSERPLLDMLKKYETEQIISPQFQRDGGLWDKDKITGWVNTIISLKAIGVVVTYQINGSGVVYLLDGLQRITSTRKFLDDPKFYGFDFGGEQAERYCDSFTITVQHRHYISHEEAMEHFQNINKGTTLTAREFYRGHLTLDIKGRVVDQLVPNIIDRYFSEFMTNRKPGREKLSKLDRDSFALFYQYMTGSKAKSFWNVGRGISSGVQINPIEKRIIDYIGSEKINDDKLRSTISNYETYISNIASEIRTIIRETEQTGKYVSATVIRWLLHLSIYKKNTGIPHKLYVDFVREFFTHQSQNSSISSRFPVPNTRPVVFMAVNIDNLTKAFSFAKKVGIDFDVKRSSVAPAAAGYHQSHIKPFSKNLNGETFIEPALRNIARGANDA